MTTFPITFPTTFISPINAAMQAAKLQIDAIRAQHLAWKNAKPIFMFYTNNVDQSPGLIYRGRINARDMFPGYQFPNRLNISSQAQFTVRAQHYIAKWIATVPNDPEWCKNIVLRVVMYGGELQWCGLGHHWKAETKDGCDVFTFWLNHDMQYPQFMLCPPNPVLAIDIFQFPRVWIQFGPGIWCLTVLFLLNLIRIQAQEAFAEAVLPSDPSDIALWENEVLDSLNPADWQAHIEMNTTFINDPSLWNIIATRMNTYDNTSGDALEDGQLCIESRRIFTDEGDVTPSTLLTPTVKNGAQVWRITDKSNFAALAGTFFTTSGFGVVNGAARSIVTWTTGFFDDTFLPVTDDEALAPDEYYQNGFLGTLAAMPGLCLRDSHWNDLQSAVTYSEATAVSVTVGGDNPGADAIVKLIIESVGNLLGYFLLGGFDSAGDIASEIIMPFLVGTIAAWDVWINTGRQTNLGWCHLWEVFQQGSENNSWSLSALAIIRGGVDATQAETSHTMVVDQRSWVIPGLHCTIGDRIMSTSGCLQRMGIDLLLIDQLYEMNLVGGEDGSFSFQLKIGQNRAALTAGEREARMMKKALDAIQNLGVHLIS